MREVVGIKGIGIANLAPLKTNSNAPPGWHKLGSGFRENGRRMRKWRERENGERMGKCHFLSLFPQFLSIFSFYLYLLFIFSLSRHFFSISSFSLNFLILLPFSLSLSPVPHVPSISSPSFHSNVKLNFVDA